jgi:arginase family enzyme
LRHVFKEHKLNINPEQIIFFGLNDEDYDIDTDELENLGLEFYTLSLIKKKGFENIINRILDSTECKILTYFLTLWI